ncbi:unnamed protein product [Brachionus calyciflorus]|uniref:Uncharacterized protein n=1 Tax=Brachionus calyciflorus TaxID=104777 RepID=A0A814S5V0_9BILA|nr:unnamed protein product [Brachionus calyciflorus]
MKPSILEQQKINKAGTDSLIFTMSSLHNTNNSILKTLSDISNNTASLIGHVRDQVSKLFFSHHTSDLNLYYKKNQGIEEILIKQRTDRCVLENFQTINGKNKIVTKADKNEHKISERFCSNDFG